MPDAAAIERITVTAETVQFGTSAATGLTAVLELQTQARSAATLDIAQLSLPASLTQHTGAVSALRLRCANPMIAEPLFSCDELRVAAQAARLPPLQLTANVALNSASGRLQAKGQGPLLAGKPLRFAIDSRAQGWNVDLQLAAVPLLSLQTLLQPWAVVPAGLQLASGTAQLALQASGGQQLASARVTGTLHEVNLQNATATVIAEKVSANVTAQWRGATASPGFETRVQGTAGQVLAGPVLLDFNVNPTTLAATGSFAAGAFTLAHFTVLQKDLSAVSGSARLQLQPVSLREAQVTLESLQFPAAYSSFLQIALATTPFASLVTRGTASGSLQIVADKPVALNLAVRDLDLADASRALRVDGVDSDLYWTAGATGPPRPSSLHWKYSQGWNIEGGETHIDFATHDADFQLLQPVRLPVFDGAMLINTLAAQNIGSDDLQGAFDAVIEPISLSRLSRAMGLPEFAGQLSGRIPGLTYRDRLLSVQGNVEAEVFAGKVVASNLKVRNPLGPWPQLYGDVTARNLDLDLVTRTFEFGNITGLLDVDLKGLETFNWSPVAFDLRLATPAGDRSRHRISQKAVKNLSSIGGGGGGVAAALQSGALRFFENFGYDRIGLSCRLANDVCEMSGVEPAKAGYYIVKGSGLPRIDIIGNSARVDWPLLMAQISTALSNTDDIVVK